MKIFTNIGLSAVAAFALILTTSVSVVAQEKVVASTDNVEMAESIEAKVLATIVQKVDTEFAQKQDEMNVEEIQVMKEPNAHDEKPFTSSVKKGFIDMPYIVQHAVGDFSAKANLSTGNCSGTPTPNYFCAYRVTTAGETGIIGNGPFTASEIDNFLLLDYLEETDDATESVWDENPN